MKKAYIALAVINMAMMAILIATGSGMWWIDFIGAVAALWAVFVE